MSSKNSAWASTARTNGKGSGSQTLKDDCGRPIRYEDHGNPKRYGAWQEVGGKAQSIRTKKEMDRGCSCYQQYDY